MPHKVRSLCGDAIKKAYCGLKSDGLRLTDKPVRQPCTPRPQNRRKK